MMFSMTVTLQKYVAIQRFFCLFLFVMIFGIFYVKLIIFFYVNLIIKCHSCIDKILMIKTTQIRINSSYSLICSWILYVKCKKRNIYQQQNKMSIAHSSNLKLPTAKHIHCVLFFLKNFFYFLFYHCLEVVRNCNNPHVQIYMFVYMFQFMCVSIFL